MGWSLKRRLTIFRCLCGLPLGAETKHPKTCLGSPLQLLKHHACENTRTLQEHLGGSKPLAHDICLLTSLMHTAAHRNHSIANCTHSVDSSVSSAKVRQKRLTRNCWREAGKLPHGELETPQKNNKKCYVWEKLFCQCGLPLLACPWQCSPKCCSKRNTDTRTTVHNTSISTLET